MGFHKKYCGLVTKKFNDFFIVETNNDKNLKINKKFLCKVRKSINFRNQIIYVGDEVFIDQIDLNLIRISANQSIVTEKNIKYELDKYTIPFFDLDYY